MKASTLSRHLREGAKNIYRNGWMTLASISSVTVTLLLVGSFLLIMMNINQMATNIEEDVEIRVYIDRTVNKDKQLLLREEIEQLENVATVEFSSKEKELEDVIKTFGDEGKAFEDLKKENPLNDVFVVKAKNPVQTPGIAKEIEKLDGIERVNFGGDTVKQLFKYVKVVRNVGLGLIIGLLFTAMFLIANTIRITILARQKEIEIMKLVGATNSFIRWPFFVEGLLLGVLGSIIPILLLTIAYHRIYYVLFAKAQTSFLTLLPFNPFMLQLSSILVLIGASIGIWGSLMSVRRFLKV